MKLIKNKGFLFILGIAVGVALIILGGILKGEELNSLASVCIGIGAGLFGMFTANLINYRIELKHPEALRKKNIEVNDERNTIIRDKAGTKTNKILMGLICIATLVFALLNVELYITLTMVGLILLEGILYVVYINYFSKRL